MDTQHITRRINAQHAWREYHDQVNQYLLEITGRTIHISDQVIAMIALYRRAGRSEKDFVTWYIERYQLPTYPSCA